MTGAQEMDMATIMSNDNVIAYPVDGHDPLRQFQKYRGWWLLRPAVIPFSTRPLRRCG